jgi:peptidoglycan/xylan/chitin deacetylase (PgdA/CDA1 family)
MQPGLLILSYHRVADSGPEKLRPWRVDAAQFTQQMQCIAASGAAITTPAEWLRNPAPGPSIAITFDDAYEDFFSAAFPVLDSMGLRCEVYVPTGHVGGCSEWDSAHGTAPIMGWDRIRALHGRGVSFNSHTHAHRRLTHLDDEEIADELAGSRDRLQQEIGEEVRTICYPYGLHNAKVRELARATGYECGVTVEMGDCNSGADALQLPRFEVLSTQAASAFEQEIAKFRRAFHTD